MFEVRRYLTADGVDPVDQWLEGLRDREAVARVLRRIDRLERGLFGDCKPCGGVWELRVDWGPGYRVYYARAGETIILLICGGDKKTQQADIPRLGNTGMTTPRRKKSPAAKVGSSVPHKPRLMEWLKNARNAAAYLEAAFDENDVEGLMQAIRNVAEAQGGVARVAEKTGLSRETLYRTLSARGNPQVKSFAAILEATGLRLAVKPIERTKRAA